MYISNNVAERIKAMAKLRNVTVKQLLEQVGLGFNTMSNMKTSMPKADNLAKIADYLDCSVDYLLGRTDDLGQGTAPLALTGVSDQESRLLAAFRSLDPIEQGIEIGRLERMVEEKDS